MKSSDNYDQYLGKPIDVRTTHSARELKEMNNEYSKIFECFKVEETQAGPEIMTTQQGLVDKALSELNTMK